MAVARDDFVHNQADIKQGGRHTDRQAGRQASRQESRQTDRQIDTLFPIKLKK